jgi:hypothetical protein
MSQTRFLQSLLGREVSVAPAGCGNGSLKQVCSGEAGEGLSLDLLFGLILDILV